MLVSLTFITTSPACRLSFWRRRRGCAIWNGIQKLSHALTLVLGVCRALFIAFYPYASGLEVSREWLARMNWFKNWMVLMVQNCTRTAFLRR
ncbi:MAG: hypothetical protein ACLS6G_14250 [Christensenellales bacterium]